MPKRLTDTEKWNDDWFLSLSNDYRMIWQWLLDNCNHAGICKRNIKLMNVMCNTNTTEEMMLEYMEGRVIVAKNDWFIPKFIKFQYTNLQSNKPVIVSVRKDLIRKSLHTLIPPTFGNDYLIIPELLDNDYLIIKDKSKDKDKDSETINTPKNGKPNQHFVNFDSQGADLLTNRIAKRSQKIANNKRKENNSQED